MTLLHSDGTGDATTTMCHRYTPPEQLPVMTKTADIVVVATGMYNNMVRSIDCFRLMVVFVYTIYYRSDSSHQSRHGEGGGSCH